MDAQIADTPSDTTPSLYRLGQASLILGILGPFTCGGSAALGLVLGVVAWVLCQRRGASRNNASQAAAGTLLSAVMIPVGLLAASVVVRARDQSRGQNCHTNLEQIGLLTLMYCQDHAGHLPLAYDWCDSAIIPYGGSPTWLRCPSAPKEPCGYALNARLSARDRTQLAQPATVPMEYDALGGWNAAGGPELFAPRHRGLGYVAYADGHVRYTDPKDLSTLTWRP